MTISLVIASYNSAPFIREALESVFAQTRLPNEIVIVDDCSTDGTPDTINESAAEAPVPLRLIRRSQNSGGPVVPMNEGVEAAAGEIIALMDHDDVLMAGRLAWQCGLLERHPECPLVFGRSRCLLPDGSITDRYSPPLTEILGVPHRQVGDCEYVLDRVRCYEAMINHRNFATGASRMCLRKEAWKRIGGFDDRVGWDAELSAQCCRLGDIGFVNQVVNHHRLYGGNLGGNKLRSLRKRTEHRLRHIRSRILDADLSPASREIGPALAGLGWFEAKEGHLLRAIYRYGQSVRYGGKAMAAGMGILKAVPHSLRAVWRARQLKS